MLNNKNKIIDIINASVTYQSQKERKALDCVNFTLYQGEHTVLRGNNGAGKSTLLKIMRGEQWIDQVFDSHAPKSHVHWYTSENTYENSALAGREMTALVAAQEQEKIVRQNYGINGEDLIYSGLTDVIYVLESAKEKERQEIFELAKWLKIDHLLHKDLNVLSQGQLRAMLIARAMIKKPKVLLFDEVSDGLDKESRINLFNLIETIAENTTLVFSTHRPQSLPTLVQREVILEKGRIISDSNNIDHLFSLQNEKEGINLQYDKSQSKINGVEIAINTADIYIDSHLILQDINWHIKPMEHWAVCGENGSGKSTLLRLLAGDEYPAYGGSITRTLPNQGGDVVELQAIKKGIRLVSDLQQATYAYDLTGEEFVLSGFDNSIGLYREIEEGERHMAQKSLALLDVEFLAQRSIRKCSTGEMRRLMLARAFIGEPDILLLDEPFSALDSTARAHVHNILLELIQKGIQIVYVSHHQEDLPDFMTHILTLSHGKIIEKNTL